MKDSYWTSVQTGRGYSYIFLYGHVPLKIVSFSGFRFRDRVSFFVEIGSTTGSILSFLTPRHLLRPFTFCECDLNRLDGNISTFSDRFFKNFQGRAKSCLRKLKDRVSFKNALLWDRTSFSEPGQGSLHVDSTVIAEE